MLDLQALPEELRDKVVAMMYDACKTMGRNELYRVRLVCVRLAATFYKRLIMLTMLKRFKPFRFDVRFKKNTGYIMRYDLHREYPNPCTLPIFAWDLYDWQGLWDIAEEMRREKIDTRSILRLGGAHLDGAIDDNGHALPDGWRKVYDIRFERELRLDQHRHQVHNWLQQRWEPSLFSIAPRPADGARIEGLDKAKRPRPWPWM